MRNNRLKQIRDQRLVEKFHELYNLKRIRIDDVLKELSEKHFYLDEDYIYARIFYCKNNTDYYNELLTKKK